MMFLPLCVLPLWLLLNSLVDHLEHMNLVYSIAVNMSVQLVFANDRPVFGHESLELILNVVVNMFVSGLSGLASLVVTEYRPAAASVVGFAVGAGGTCTISSLVIVIVMSSFGQVGTGSPIRPHPDRAMG